MKKPGRLLGQRILIGAKGGQRVLTKPVELDLCRFMGDSPTKGRQVSRVFRKSNLYYGNHRAGDVIVLGFGSRRDLTLPAPAGAVVGIVIPLATLGLIGIHQNPITLAHIAIKILHAQLFAARSPV